MGVNVLCICGTESKVCMQLYMYLHYGCWFIGLRSLSDQHKGLVDGVFDTLYGFWHVLDGLGAITNM